MRGRCLIQDCSCDEYQSEGGKAACCYCLCPPTKHEQLSNFDVSNLFGDLTNKSRSSNASLEAEPHDGISCEEVVINSSQASSSVPSPGNIAHRSVSATVTSQVENKENAIELQPNNTIMVEILSAHKSTHNTAMEGGVEIQMPAILPDEIELALASGKLSANQRATLCRSVVHGLLYLGRSSNQDMLMAAHAMVSKYPPMKRLTDPGNKALYKKLLDCRNRYLHSISSDESEGQRARSREPTKKLSGKEAQEAIVKKWSEGERSVTIMAPLLVETRPERRKEAAKTKALSLLMQYPPLTVPSLLIGEFETHPDICPTKSSQMKDRWKQILPKLITYLNGSAGIVLEDTLSEDEKTVQILSNLHKIPVWCKKKDKDSRSVRVLECYPENTPLTEIRPNIKDSPRLSAIQEGHGYSIHCMVDLEPIFVSSDPVEAIILLIATYWEFCLNFGKNKYPVLFLACIILSPAKVSKYIGRNDKFLDLCRSLGMVV